MRSSHLKSLFLLLMGLVLNYSINAQTDSLTNELKKNIENAFKELKNSQKMALEPQFEEQLQKKYFDGIKKLKPENFYYSERAIEPINFYSTTEGIKDILKEWFKATEVGHREKIFSLDSEIYLKIYLETKDPDVHPFIPENIPNKYAILFIEIKPDSLNPDIFIDGEFVATINDATNGIRFPSEKYYNVEIRFRGAVYCREEIILEKQERRTKRCNIENY